MNARSEDHDEPRTGPEMIAEGGRALPLVSARLQVDAGGGLARIVLEQEFRNDGADVLRVTYKMPLPADGAVSGYEFRIGERTITGRVDGKKAAREQFETAIAQGKTAALLEQDKPDIFTQEIGNVPPKASIVARITVDQRLAWLAEGEWELRFPTVIGPRYVSARDSAETANAVAVETSEKPLAARIHLELRIRDAITPGRAAASPSHSLSGRSDGVIELRSVEGARLDRELVVRWPVSKPAMGVTLETGRPATGKPNAEFAYGLLTIVPPSAEARIAAMPRDLIVLLDTSGSMGGTPLELGKKIVGQLLASLGEKDRFELVEFSSRPNSFHVGPLPGTAKDKKAAIDWLNRRTANGGTEMHTAVMEAMKSLRGGSQRQVVLVTDGYIGGEEQILALLQDKLPESCRLHVVGVGAAPNRALAASLARAGRGVEVLVGPGEDLERGTKRILDKTRAPVLTDLVIEGDAIVAAAPEHAPDVFEGSPVLAALQMKPEGGEILVRGKLAHGEWQQRVRVPAVGEGEGNAAIPALYARERVADLDIRWCMGRNVEGIDRAVERLGVDFQIATRLTSWVAIDDQASVDPYAPTRHEVIPQELPYGTSLQSFGLAPQSYATTRAGTLRGRMPMGLLQAARAPGFGGPPPAAMAPPPPPMPAQSFSAGSLGESLERSKGEAAGGAAPLAGPASPAPETYALARKSRRIPLFRFLWIVFFLLVLGVAAYFLFR